MPEMGTFVRFKPYENSDWILGMTTEYFPVCFVEGNDSMGNGVKKYQWNEVYEYQVAIFGKGFEE